MAFDLSSIAPKNTSVLELVHPSTKEPLGAFVTLAGPSHPETLKADRESLDKHLTQGEAVQTSTSIERELASYLAARTLGWEGIERQGVAVPFSTSEAIHIFTDPDLRWLRDQVDAALRSKARFFPVA